MFERLAAWGVRRIDGYPGEGISGVVSAAPARSRELFALEK
jgi:hypothetical protein